MKRLGRYFPIAIATVIAITILSCSEATVTSEPKASISPITIGDDLTKIDVCAAIPKEDIEAVMGRKLAVAPRRFDYYETQDTSGCWYEAAKDADKTAHFGYVVLTPISAYSDQPLHLKPDVTGIGDEAYFNNGADARQLWVKMSDKVAFVVTFGDIENEAGAKSLAKLVAAAIK